MIFQIEFNWNSDPNSSDKNLKKLGATQKFIDDVAEWHEIEINTIEEMKDLYVKVNAMFGDSTFDYSLIVNFDETPAIYLDNKM